MKYLYIFTAVSGAIYVFSGYVISSYNRRADKCVIEDISVINVKHLSDTVLYGARPAVIVRNNKPDKYFISNKPQILLNDFSPKLNITSINNLEKFKSGNTTEWILFDNSKLAIYGNKAYNLGANSNLQLKTFRNLFKKEIDFWTLVQLRFGMITAATLSWIIIREIDNRSRLV